MNRIKRYINNSNISRFRFIIQLISFFALVYGGYWGLSISENIPTFACPYNNYSSGTCYIITLQHRAHMAWADFASYRGIAFFMGLFFFFLWFIVLNKAWCGFICPLGTIQDWITKLREKMGIRFTRYNSKEYKKLSKIKYIFLFLLIVIPLGMSNSFFGLPHFSHDLSAPFCQTCPGRTVLPLFTGDGRQFIIDFTNTTTIIMSSLGIMMTALFFVGSFLKKRFFCLICPMSALQYIFSKAGLLRLSKTGDKCTKCGNCSRVCDIGIKDIETDLEQKNLVTENCMLCMKCVEACPENDALKIKFTGISLFDSTSEGFSKRYADKLNDFEDKKEEE